MPIYEYEREDGTIFEVKQSISEEPLSSCPTTGQKVRKIISRTAFKLEGGGWYKDGYSSTSAGSSASKTSGEAAASSSPEPSAPAKGSCGSGCGCQ